MELQFRYIVDLATVFSSYSADSFVLFEDLNKLPKNVIEEIFDEYGDPEREFKPVNLLRAETAKKLLSGEAINEEIVQELKQKIRAKDIKYFNHYNKNFLEQIESYTISKRDLFANWQNPWNVYHTFYYRGKVKETVQNYLNQIANDLIIRLDLNNYKCHTVDFQGPNNFGSNHCWIALYPRTKASHKEAYQFFLRLDDKSQAGREAGSELKKAKLNLLEPVNSYEETITCLEKMKPEIIPLNNASRNYFKFAPGKQASEWDRFYNEKLIAIDFDAENLDPYESKSDLKASFGLITSEKSNKVLNLWSFKSANINDVVFATRGVNTCIGVGIITGAYSFDINEENFRHKRTVNWVTNKVYQNRPNSQNPYKYLFRPDTFSPTKVGSFLLGEYLRTYPELKDIFVKHNLIIDQKETSSLTTLDSNLNNEIDQIEEVRSIDFWWLNANPSIWKISSHNEGDFQTYTSHNEKGNKRRIYKYFEAAKPGDIIIGYESSPTKQIKAIYEVTKGLHLTEKGEEIEFELIEKLELPVHWNEIKNNPGLQNCEVFINNQGSLFRLTEEEYDIIREVIDNKNILTEKVYQKNEIKRYDFLNDLDKPFISEQEFRQTVNLLKRKKNIILQGPPGVGKTFIARKLAYELMEEINDINIEMVQFHQSYSYEDFIQGLRPIQKGGFELKEGIFYSFCQRAIAHPNRPFFFIIDEINRGNLSKIFGEMMMLIEMDKRHERFALKLTYSEDQADKFYVPDNVYIIGTMNTSDRSLAIVDFALRRRFVFISLQPDYGQNFKSFLSNKGMTSNLVDHICASVSKVNNKIKEDPNLGAGFQIGHSYFCTYSEDQEENQWWNEVLDFELKPLLEEIWFDDNTQVEDILKQLTR